MKAPCIVLKAPYELPPVLELPIPFAHHSTEAVRSVGLQPCPSVILPQIRAGIHQVLYEAVVVAADFGSQLIF